MAERPAVAKQVGVKPARQFVDVNVPAGAPVSRRWLHKWRTLGAARGDRYPYFGGTTVEQNETQADDDRDDVPGMEEFYVKFSVRSIHACVEREKGGKDGDQNGTVGWEIILWPPWLWESCKSDVENMGSVRGLLFLIKIPGEIKNMGDGIHTQ